MVRALQRLILWIISQLLVVFSENCLIIRVQFEDGIDNIVELLELTSKSALELFALFETAVNFNQLSLSAGVHTLTFFNKQSSDFISHFRLSFILCTSLAGHFTLLTSLLLSHACSFNIVNSFL